MTLEEKKAIYPFNTRAEFDAYLKGLADFHKRYEAAIEGKPKRSSDDDDSRRRVDITANQPTFLKGPGF